MKSDIPQLMHERALDAIVVCGNTDISTDLSYVTGGARLEGAVFVQRRDGSTVLVASDLERENAAATGHPTRLWSEWDLTQYMEAANGDRLQATLAQWADLLRDLSVSGRVGFYGVGASARTLMGDVGAGYLFLDALGKANATIQPVGELAPTLFSAARETKDNAELAAMRRVGQRTCEVISSVIAFLQAHNVQNETLIKPDGGALTIGDVKAHIRLELVRRNLTEAHENIFSQGRDAAIGHNVGQWDMPLRLGQSIVFDIFPRDAATGYFHDITRTFFLGYAPEHLAVRWRQVKTMYDLVLERMRVGELCSSYQAMTCDYFEDLGFPTTRSNPKTQRGYNHSLGHGVGLDVHEGPSLRLIAGNTTRLQPGHVVSVEPGLYDPDEGWGIRIEDTVAFDESGNLLNLSDFPYDMIIPM